MYKYAYIYIYIYIYIGIYICPSRFIAHKLHTNKWPVVSCEMKPNMIASLNKLSVCFFFINQNSILGFNTKWNLLSSDSFDKKNKHISPRIHIIYYIHMYIYIYIYAYIWVSVGTHRKYFQNLVNPNQIWIIITLFRWV